MESAVQNTFNDPIVNSPTSTTTMASYSSLDLDDQATSTASNSVGGSIDSQINNNNNNSDHHLFSASSSLLSRHMRPIPSQPTLQAPRQSSQQPIPSVNILQPRTLSYPTNRMRPPQGFFQWSLFLVSFPFKLIVSSLYELVSFFMALFDHSSAIPIDYDPLANIAEFTIDYNQKFGTNHPEFFAGSYYQVRI